MAAIRHKIRTRMYLGDTWVDVTDDVLVRDKIKISKGRANESTESAPMTSLFTLKNADLQWSQGNPLSPYVDDLKRNVPVTHELILAEDDFDRTSLTDLGTAQSGQRWAQFGVGGTVAASDITAQGGVARFSVPAVTSYRAAYLTGESLYNVAVEATFQLPTANVTGGNLEPGNIMLRFQSNTTYYLVRVIVDAAEAVSVTLIAIVNNVETTISGPVTISGLTNTGQRIRVRGYMEDETLRAKVWAESSPEPLTDNIAVRDTKITLPGSVGVRCGVSSGNTNALPLVFSIDDFVFYSPRFRGELSSMVLMDNEKGTDRTAKCQAAGILRRLGQGTAPVMSSLKRAYLNIGPSLVAYWPCEEGDQADSIASALGGFPMNVVGSPDFAVNSDFPCSKPVPQLNESGWFGDVPNYGSTGQIQLRFLLSIPDSGAIDDRVIARIGCGGTATLWEVIYLTGGALKIKAYNIAGNNVFDSGALGFGLNGVPSRVSFELQNDGADVDWQVSCLSVAPGAIAGFLNGTLAGFNVGEAFQVQAGPQGVLDDVAVGHISLESARTDLFANLRELQAHFGEDAGARLSRLCSENGIAFTHYESGPADGTLMGYQRPLKLLELLRECERTDGGVLHELRGRFSLEYRSRKQVYAQTAKLTVDVAAKQVGFPFRPRVDDQLTRNDVTVEQPDGSSARAELTAGPMSVQDYPDGIGRVDTTAPVNTSSTSLLPNHAEWRLAIGTVTEPRTAEVILNVDATETKPLKYSILDLVLNDKIVFSNAGVKTGYYDPMAQLLQGMTEEWTNHIGAFVLNGAPEGPYAVGVVNADKRLDSGSSTLNGALSASATGTFSVAVSALGDLWITTANHQPDVFGTNHFPVDIMIGGERITVSGISGATSPQTFTISARGVNGVKQSGFVGKAHASGVEVHVAEPFILGL